MSHMIVSWFFICCLCSKIKADFSEDTFQCKSDGKLISGRLECSGFAQCEDCSDEMNCNETEAYGEKDFPQLSCNGENQKCFSENHKCDARDDCGNCFDEYNCNPPTVFHCSDGRGCVSIDDVCDGTPGCPDESDERIVGFGFKCPSYEDSRGAANRCIFPQSFLHQYNANRTARCTNKDDDCFDANGFLNTSRCWPCLDGTIIHRQQVRDNVFDCPDLSDECLGINENDQPILALCESLLSKRDCAFGEVSCIKNKEEKCIVVSQICDGRNFDCDNNIDELFCSRLSECPEPKPEKYSCLNGNSGSLGNKCDGKIECANAEDECNNICTNELKYCQFIQYGHVDLTNANTSCTERLDLSKLCDTVNDCEDAFDEKYCQYLRSCDPANSSAGTYDVTCNVDRCNLIADCENIVDELGCSQRTHYYCDDNKTFVPVWKRFDKVFDCDDYTDECTIDDSESISSRTHLISNYFFTISIWVFMLLAIVGNSIVIVKTMKDLSGMIRRRLNCTSQRVGVCNKTMILNLALSDFLMGLYLLIIASKAIELDGKYCEERSKWLQSGECVFSGIVAVVSGQTSVFLMVLMTSYRLYGVINPFRAEKLRCKLINAIIAAIWLIALLLAIVPILPGQTAAFANKLIIDQPYMPSIDIKQLNQMLKIANKLPGLNKTFPTDNTLSQQSFCSLFKHLNASMPQYCREPDAEDVSAFGYYSSDGVCLPRFYGNPNEPASVYTLVVVSFNFVSFVYIFIAYVIIYRSTSIDKHHSHENSGSVCDVRSKENQALWGKIFRLILTDFVCWFPICVMSFLSFSGIRIPSGAYQATAIYLIPINSAANPWIYSSFLLGYVRDMWNSQRGMKWFGLRHFKLKEKGKAKTTETRSTASVNHTTCCGLLRRNKASLDITLPFNSPSSVTNNTNDGLTMATEL